MKQITPEVKVHALLGVLAAVAVLGLSVLATQMALQVTLLGILLVLSCTVGSASRVLLIAGSVVPFVAFIRRVSAGPEAHVDFDPLILLPFILVGLAIISGLRRRSVFVPDYRRTINRRIMSIAVVFTTAVAVSIVLDGAIKADVLYFAAALVMPILLVAMVATRAVSDIWPAYERIMPFLGLIVGIYGVIQFLFLPDWDKNWMVSSELQSIGQPSPLAVRVFGMSESPGPYAAFLGLAIILCVNNALNCKAFRQVGWFVFAGALVVPLLLSGVRSALLSLLICAAIATVVRGKGIGRVAPVVFFAIVGVGIDRLVSAFGSNSTILTPDRYTSFDPSQDGSVQARLTLVEYLVNPWPHVIGNPTAAPVDNLPIDIMRAYGFLPFAIFVLLLILLIRFGLRLTRWNESSSVGLSTLYILILGISGNLFLSSFGILMGLVFGSALRRVLDAGEEGRSLTHPLSVKVEAN